MNKPCQLGLLLWLLSAPLMIAQEANSGVDLRATLTAQGIASEQLTEAPRSTQRLVMMPSICGRMVTVWKAWTLPKPRQPWAAPTVV